LVLSALGKQPGWFLGTTVLIIFLIAVGILLRPSSHTAEEVDISLEMSIRDIAPTLGLTGRALAREFGLPLDVSKKKTPRHAGRQSGNA